MHRVHLVRTTQAFAWILRRMSNAKGTFAIFHGDDEIHKSIKSFMPWKKRQNFSTVWLFEAFDNAATAAAPRSYLANRSRGIDDDTVDQPVCVSDPTVLQS